jgi:ASC-1-like (ASCH) protein
MEHAMRLSESAFDRIASGKKTVEVRLFDEKRRTIAVGDTIIFSKLPDLSESLRAKVTGLLQAATFKELVDRLPMHVFGHPEDYEKQRYIDSFHTIYSIADEKRYGVLGIEIRLCP